MEPKFAKVGRESTVIGYSFVLGKKYQSVSMEKTFGLIIGDDKEMHGS